jgi:hypothetical protein
MTIKILLVLATLALGVVVLRGGSGRRLALRRLLGCGVVGGGVVAIIWPDAVTWVAQLVGVGRGTDLVLYVMVMFFLFTTASLYQRLKGLETQITVLVRELALTRPERPADMAVDPAAAAGQEHARATVA